MLVQLILICLWFTKGLSHMGCKGTGNVSSTGSLLPNRTMWATGYVGTLYTFYRTSISITWNITLSDKRNDVATHLINNLIITSQNFESIKGISSTSCCNSASSLECSTFDVILPLNQTLNQARLRVLSGGVWATIIVVQDCPITLANNVTVVNTTQDPAVYKTFGHFSCPDNSQLFQYGQPLNTSDTRCLETAKWSGQESVECWSAPTVNLSTNLTDFEGFIGDGLILSCNYADTIPNGYSSIFYVGTQGYNISKNDNLRFVLTLDHNGKNISCQADTPFTQIYNSTGRSLPIKLQVYEPYAPNSTVSVVNCSWGQVNSISCSFNFTSYPQSITFKLSSNSEAVNCTNCHFAYDEENKESQSFFLILESTGKNEIYSLKIYSVKFADMPLEAKFRISAEIDGGNGDLTLIIAVVVSAVVVVVLIAASGIFIYRRKIKSKSQDSNNENIPPRGTENFDNVEDLSGVDGNVDVMQKTKSKTKFLKKELAKSKHSGNDTTENLAFDRNDQKEERINPLYAASTATVAETYTVVQKTKTTATSREFDLHSNGPCISEKEDRLNPLYVPSHQTSQLNKDDDDQSLEASTSGFDVRPPKPAIRKKPNLIPKPQNYPTSDLHARMRQPATNR